MDETTLARIQARLDRMTIEELEELAEELQVRGLLETALDRLPIAVLRELAREEGS